MLILLKMLLSQGQEILLHYIGMRINVCTPVWYGERFDGFPKLMTLDWVYEGKVVPLSLAVA